MEAEEAAMTTRRTPLRVLLVDSDTQSAATVLEALRRGGYAPIAGRAHDPDTLARALVRRWDVVLSDYRMPGLTAPDALRILERSGNDAPLIVVSAARCEEAAVDAMRAGARDFLRKDDIARLVPAIERELHEAAGRRRARRTQVWLRVLADTGKLFAQSLETRDSVRSVCRAISSELTQACVMDLVDDAASPYRAAAEHGSSRSRRRLAELSERHPPRWHAEPAMIALRQGETVVVPEIRRADGREARSAFLAIAGALGLRSALCAPMKARGKIIGALNVANREGYDEIDRCFLEELAGRAALAIDNARLYAGACEAVKARDEFLSVAAHELRTPLTALQLQIQSLSRHAAVGEPFPPNAGAKLGAAVRHTARISRLVDRLLDTSRIAAGALELHVQPCDLAKIAREAAATYEEMARASGTEIHVVGSAVLPVRADRVRVEQILANLISNASRHGRGRPVEVALSEDEGWAVVQVTDEGTGVAEEDRARIFDRFERGPERTTSGLGLGLYVSRSIAQAHGGSLSVASEPGAGATFVLRLPLEPPGARADAAGLSGARTG